MENEKKPIGFDPMTGEPIYGDAPKKTFRIKKVIAIPIAAAAAAAVVFAGVSSGAFLPKQAKVLMAVKKTLTEDSGITNNLKGLKMLESDGYTMTFSGNVENDFGGEATFVNGSNQKQLFGEMDIDYIDGIEFIGNLTKEELQLQMPGISDDIYIYNYVTEKDGYITDLLSGSEIETIDRALETVYSTKEQKNAQKELTKIMKDFVKGLKFESAGKEEFEVDDKERKCKGYRTTITENDLSDLIDDLEDFSDDYYGDALDAADMDLKYVFREMREEIDIPDVDVTFYLYKGKLACVMTECGRYEGQLVFHGGKTRMQNIELLVDNDTVAELEGRTDKHSESYELSLDGRTWMEFTYDSKSGDYSLETDLGYSGNYTIEGVLKGNARGMEFAVNRFEVDDYDVDIDFNISLEKGTKFQKLSGDKVDIGNASESELRDMISDVEEAFSDMEYY